MFQLSLLHYYLIGRIIFAVALQIAFHFTGDVFILDRLVLLIGLYGFLALMRLIFNPHRIHYFDFLLDICFVSAIIFISIHFYSYTYLTLLYLFPIFFASLSVKGNIAFLFPFISIFLYGIIFYFSDILIQKESIINLILHFIAFILIFIAGKEVSNKIYKQEEHIKQLEEDRIKMQGYERLFRVSADLAHELRNPLTSISASIQFLKEGKNPKDFIEMLDEETKRISNLINDFLIFARPSDATKEYVRLSVVINKIIESFKHSEKQFQTYLDDNIVVYANKTFLDVALNNVIKNSVEASHKRIIVTSKLIYHHPFGISLSGKYPFAEITVEDDGLGISDEIKDKVFEPFVTTKPNGTGLGMAITYRIITDIGGNISIDKSKIGGASFKIYIPTKNSDNGI